MRLVEDYKQFVSGGGIKKISTLFLNPCFHAVCLFRLSSTCYHCHLSVFAKIIWYINRLLFHVDIDYRADLAGGFVMVHGLGVIIGKSVISKGKLCVYQNVTIGGGNGKTPRKDDDGLERGMPLILPGCIICANAIVVGGIRVSENSFIKAGSIVSDDI